MKIGYLNLDNPVFSAPMAGISDLPYRLMMKRQGAALVFTEMISANGLFFNGQATRALLRSVDEERPLAIQLFGEDAGRLADAAAIVAEYGDLIDLNLGCPVRKVVRSGAGSALLREPLKVAEILKAVRRATSRPLTIKFRSGWDQESINYLEIARIAVDSGIDAITLHPRTKNQMFGGSADWSQIRRLKERVAVPVIGSGDLFCAEDAITMFEKTGCDAVMFGRGGYGNPWVVRQTLDLLAGRRAATPTTMERLMTIRQHFDLSLECFGPQKTLGLMRKHLCWYVRGMNGAAGFRTEINQARSIDEMRDRLEGFFAHAA